MANSPENIKWKDYIKDKLIPTFDANISEFDKTVLLIAGGIFTFSITFIKDIVHLETAISLYLLFWGWIFLGASISCMMFTLFGTAYQTEKIITEIDEAVVKDLTEQDSAALRDTINLQRKKRAEGNKCLRRWSIILFSIGILLISIFLYFNLTKPNDHKINITTTNSTVQTTIIIDSNGRRTRTTTIDSNGKIEKTIIVDSSSTQK